MTAIRAVSGSPAEICVAHTQACEKDAAAATFAATGGSA